MWHGWGTAEVHPEFWWGDLREGEPLEGLGTDRMII